MSITLEKETSIQALCDGLRQDVGYSPDAIVRNFPVPMRHAEVDVLADVIAFDDSTRKDQRTACIAARWARNGEPRGPMLEPLLLLACPLTVILTPKQAEFYPVDSSLPPAEWREEAVPYVGLRTFLAQNRSSFESRTLTEAKHTPTPHPTFFDYDPRLLDFARDATGQSIKQRVERAVLALVEKLGPNNEQDAIKIALQLVAAQAIGEKLQFPVSLARADARSLLSSVQARFPGYFPAPRISDFNMLDQALDILRRGMTLRALSNDILSYLYENVFLAPQDVYRKALGIHYTPPQLARQILSRVPIETIPPNQRHVLDPTCGSGTFIRAAYDRLDALLPRWRSIDQRYLYLSQHLWGIDKDVIAPEIARLSLLLHSLPSGNSWNIIRGEFPSALPSHARPSIIVGNPPFGGEGEDAKSREEQMSAISTRPEERAVSFLVHSINVLPPNGLLAMILPESFLGSNKCQRGRDELFQKTDVTEVWHLPRSVMPMSVASTVVVFARKLETPNPVSLPVKVQWTLHRKKDEDVLRQYGRPTFFTLLDNTKIRDAGSIPRPQMWDRLRAAGTLADHADVISGIRGTDATLGPRPQGETWHKWLDGLKYLQAYGHTWQKQTDEHKYIDFPGKLMRAPSEKHAGYYRMPKVIVSAVAVTGGNPWRLYGAIDKEGMYPNGHTHCLIPKSGDPTTPEELVAIANGSVMNAWLYLNCPTKTNTTRMIEQSPFPSLTNAQRQKLAPMVHQLEHLDLRTHGDARRRLFVAIDDLLNDAYQLDQDDRDLLSQIFGGAKPPKERWSINLIEEQGKKQESITPEVGYRPVVGVVKEIDYKGLRMRVWLSSLDTDADSVWVDIPSDCPGWLLRQDMDFSAHLNTSDAGNPTVSAISALDYGYLTDEQLVAEFEE